MNSNAVGQQDSTEADRAGVKAEAEAAESGDGVKAGGRISSKASWSGCHVNLDYS